MEYDFQKLADVELLEEVPDGASAFVAVDGVVKRVPGSGLGGGGVATAILRVSSAGNPTGNRLPITCDNYTYAQARAMLEAGDPFAVMIFESLNNIQRWMTCFQVDLSDNCISMMFITKRSKLHLYWDSDGFFDKE